MRKIKIAQIGVAHDHAAPIMESLRRQSDIFEVVGYAVPEGERITNPKPYEGAPQLTVDEALSFPGLDAVAVEAAEKSLTKYALAAAEKGIAVHMDKPGGLELADFEKLISTLKKNNTVFSAGYMYRYNPAVQKLMGQIKDGKLGEIYSVEAQMSCPHYDGKRAWLGELPGGMTFFLGCHLIDLIYRIQGEPTEVIPLNSRTGINGINAEDYGMVCLKYRNGISFAKTSAIEPGGFLRRQLVVVGSRGSVQLMPLEEYEGPNGSSDLHTGVREVFDGLYDWFNDGNKYRSKTFNRYDTMLRSFAEYITGEKENPYTYDYELNLYRLILRCCGVDVDSEKTHERN